MGRNLIPHNPSPDHPKDKYGWETVHHNWSGWSRLCDLLIRLDIDLSEFRGCNDGDIISEATCTKVYNVVKQHWNTTLTQSERDWLEGRIELWKTCGGWEQY